MRGSVASARASSTRFCPATLSSAALTPARSPSPTRSSTRAASRRASSSLGWRSMAPTMAFSSTVISPKLRGIW